MEGFVNREKLRFLRDRLTRANDEAECQRIVKRIEAEESKGHSASNSPLHR